MIRSFKHMEEKSLTFTVASSGVSWNRRSRTGIPAGVKVAGITVHYVDEGMDTGPIIAQKAIEIDEHDTLETIEQRIHKLEHKWYPSVIKQLLGLNNRGEKA